MKFKVNVLQRHIDEGECGYSNRCMEKLAITSALIKHLGLNPERDADEINKLKVKIDSTGIKFNYDGYRYVMAPPPKDARKNLIAFDKAKGDPVKLARIKPHNYTVIAARTSKIEPFTRERQDQINRARQRRIAQGRPDKPAPRNTVHERVVGMAAGYG